MKMILKSVISYLGLSFLFIVVSSCGHIQPVPERTMEFEEGMKLLARNISHQLNNSGKLPPLYQLLTKNLTIDPFIDGESGYPLKDNAVIKDIFVREFSRIQHIVGMMEPENLDVSDFILNGLVTLEQKSGEREKTYHVYSTVFEKTTGKVVASASVWISGIDTSPMELYRDSPAFLRGRSLEDQIYSVKQQTGSTVAKGYSDRLSTKALMIKGDLLYGNQNYGKSLDVYNEAANRQKNDDVGVMNGQFTNLIKLRKFDEAEKVYAKLLKKSVLESNRMSIKIFFAPNSSEPLGVFRDQYKIYIREIAALIATYPGCGIQITGHCSKTGTEEYNDKLSLRRAEWIQNQILTYYPENKAKIEVFGRGFRENIVGTGKDDITDAIDRRVEFNFINCSIDEKMVTSEGKGKGQSGVAPVVTVTDKKPLEVSDIEYYLKNKVSSKLIANRISERGVNFELTSDIRKRLKKSKADERIFTAIDKANGKKKLLMN